MKIYNTLTRQKEELVTLEPGVARIYACGPTVYNYIHIGNARPLCVFDVLRRYLEWRGYEVKFVQNFTDIDDKIIRRANEEGVGYQEIAARYIEEFWVDAKGLGVREATVHPKATENMEEIESLIAGLVEKGEDYHDSAVRELYEETGLTLTPLKVDEAYQKPYFTSVGMSDESCAAVYGYASGTVSTDAQEASEEIQVVLADREEVKRILREERVSIMCAYMLMHFLKDEKPFEFLEVLK